MLETLQLAAALADANRRADTARALAAHVGSEALLAFIADPELDTLVLAPGFQQALPGGRAWRDLLNRCRTTPGFHDAELDYPKLGVMAPACAYAASGIALVFVAGRCTRQSVEPLAVVLPLMAATFRAEHSAVLAERKRQDALQDALQADTLARALEVARADAERAIAQLARQATALDEVRTKAEAATRAKDEFLAMLGHELRNPLSPILTALQILRLKGDVSHEHEIIERQVTHLMELVDDLLDVSRITSGRVELHKQRIELAAVVERAIELSSPLLERKRQLLEVDVSLSGLLVDADAARLAQVIANLLINAAKYSEVGRPVMLTARRTHDHIQLRVKDEGIGIPAAMLEQVFHLFVQQTPSAERTGGLGLGLAIVRSLVGLHGGAVWAESEGSGRGSEFIVELPAADERMARPVAARSHLTTSESKAVDASSSRILVVDDNEDAGELLGRALTALGYEIRVAMDGPSALRVADGFAPHVALLDIGLPVMDGYELARRLRTSCGAGLKLVAITGYGQASDKARAQTIGFDAHLVKPVDLSTLRTVLETLRQDAAM
jgi:signal transduction histidine kinase/CheY-like chemotaxis protein